MDSSRYFIVGAYGQLGKALQAQYPDAVAVDRDQFDMTNWAVVSGYDWSKVDVILNAAAYTNVDGAETAEGRELAWKINATGPSYLAKVAAVHDLTLVHVSSEYVFDGTKVPHSEAEPLTPLGVYAQTKAAGDIAVSTTPKHYIARTSWLIGDGSNFVRTMISLAGRDISPTVVGDQIGRLTFTDTLVAAIDQLLHNQASYGIYNISNEGEPASWADVSRTIFSELGRSNLTVTNTTTAEYYAAQPESSPRPLQSAFDLSKIRAAGVELSDWKTELHNYIQKEQTV